VYSTPRGEDSTFVAVFNPSSYKKVMHYNKLDNRVSVILPVNNSVSNFTCSDANFWSGLSAVCLSV